MKQSGSAITVGFTALRDNVRRQRLSHEIPKPKFAIQGSYIYGTLNDPENPPIQQVDIDLGMYLPFSSVGDGLQPKTAAKYYFDQVTTILEHYIAVNQKYWVLLTNAQQKDTCIRVILDAKTHIDIPLYAVPKGELNRVTEERRKNPVAHDRDCICNCVNAHDSLIYERKNHGQYPIE